MVKIKQEVIDAAEEIGFNKTQITHEYDKHHVQGRNYVWFERHTCFSTVVHFKIIDSELINLNHFIEAYTHKMWEVCFNKGVETGKKQVGEYLKDLIEL